MTAWHTAKKQERHFKWKSIFFSHTSRTMSFQGTDRTGKHTSTRYTIPSNGKCKSDFGNRRVWKSPFYNKEQKEAILTKGMYAFINQKGQMQINKQSDPNTFAWKTHVFVYNEAPLKKVVKELEEVYKVHIGGIPQKSTI